MSQQHLDARRRQILDGARRCFAEHGYEGATVRRLEEATGLSRGAIFHHFRDKESLFVALAEDDAKRMAEIVAQQGLVQLMRDLITSSRQRRGDADTRSAPDRHWLGAHLEVSRRLRTDPDFRPRWAEQSRALTAATVERLHRQLEAGKLRTDVPIEVLAAFLELALEGLLSKLAMGLPPGDLEPVLDVVEASVRR